MDSLKSSIKSYWNWRSKSYGHDVDKSVVIADSWQSILKELVSELPGKRALDIGTGTGQLAIYLAKAGFNVTGIDLAENMVSQAQQYADMQKLDIDFQTGDAEALPFEDNSFDVVVSRNLLWTLPNPNKALKEWRRVLKPGGTVVISDGFWMNTTKKRLHHLVSKIIKGLFGKKNAISLRFFWSYLSLQKSLPFYEGICFDKASKLLHTASFKDIQAYDTSVFDFNPYRMVKKDGKIPSFFIAYAKR